MGERESYIRDILFWDNIGLDKEIPDLTTDLISSVSLLQITYLFRLSIIKIDKPG